ncbi:SSI family serine proteinase inhibitor [Nonomuraea sp. NPDC003709]|uniref:SSI family serine proteinase inhibitor n=1 Tax=Nonomuraea sp. NPDC003709 TaxID=3154450 RepID=UPI0033BAA795
MMRAFGAIALCGAFMVGASSPAVAAPHPKAQLKIVDAVKDGVTKTVWLNCGPAGGAHPNARAACRLLEKVDGHPERLNVTPDAICTKELQPHVVVVAGQWQGTTVQWAKVFGNGCTAKAALGAVVSF